MVCTYQQGQNVRVCTRSEAKYHSMHPSSRWLFIKMSLYAPKNKANTTNMSFYQIYRFLPNQNVNFDTMLMSDKSLCLQAFLLCQSKKPPFRRASGRRFLNLFVFGMHPRALSTLPFVYGVRFRVRSLGKRVHGYRERVQGCTPRFFDPLPAVS
jgi:hypothetical protein